MRFGRSSNSGPDHHSGPGSAPLNQSEYYLPHGDFTQTEYAKCAGLDMVKPSVNIVFRRAAT